jgi:hypothetical protein
MSQLHIRRPYRTLQSRGRVWGVNLTGIIFNTEGNSADRKSQERNTLDFPIGTHLAGELYARREARCVRVWRRRDLLRDGITEEQLEGRGTAR